MSLLESRHAIGSAVERRTRGMRTVRSLVGMDVHKETILITAKSKKRNMAPH
jgi:hypothetical protein